MNMLRLYKLPHFLLYSASKLSSKSVSRCTSNLISKHSLEKCLRIHPEVKVAIEENAPVVALESAIITHGMKFPFNSQTALDVESIIRNEGALPATIGIIDGQVHVGLSKDQINFLAECKSNCIKVSRRDLPYALAKKLHGGTTVSGTMIIAHLVGIPVFVTGGIGGVHRGAQDTMDVSADLTELGRTPLSVVCAGVKSILDVGRTLEYLETQGVCVATIGHSKAFPDFFTKDSGFEAPCHLESCFEAAQVMLKHRELDLSSGILFAVPIPTHQEADGQLIKKSIEQALMESKTKVRGRDVTPFVLQRLAELTDGRSLFTNIDLVKNNAEHGARIAVEYSRMINDRKINKEHGKAEESDKRAQPVC